MSKIEVDTIDTVTGTSTLQVGSTNTSTINLGASGDTINIPSGATITNSGTATGFDGVFESQLLHVRDEKSSSTSGGTFTQGAWQTRDLNTVVTNEITGASLSSNQITLPSGTYYIDASAPAYRMTRHMARLVNVTDSASAVNGSSEYGLNTDLVQTRSFITGRFTIASEKDFEIQHYGENSTTTFGFGVESNQITSIYTDVRIWRIA